mgnify:FL=1
MQDIEEIYQKYAGIVYKYIFCLTENENLAEEIVQETFCVAIKNINKFRGDSKISTWLCQIAKYIWYEKLRKQKKQKEIPIDELENTVLLENFVEEEIFQKEDKIELFKKMQKLDEQTRNVMYLRILGDLSYEEIGEVMGKTSNWARVVFFRGKQKIKEENKNEERM